MVYGDSITVQGEGTTVSIQNLNVYVDGGPDSLEARLAAILTEAINAWKENPEGPIQFHEAIIEDTYIGRHPLAR